MDARTCAHLLAKHIPEEIRILPSYLMPSWKLMELMLLLNKLGNAPEPFNREQRRFCCARIVFRWACVIGQTRGDGSVIPIRHADDEVGVRSSADPNELHALVIQGMMGWVTLTHSAVGLSKEVVCCDDTRYER
jgi:hypothetical protein